VTCIGDSSSEGCINVRWLDAPADNAAGVKAHNYPITGGRFSIVLDSGGWWHWVKGPEEGAFYNGLGANPGTYRFTASCECGAGAARAEALFTITDDPPVYLVGDAGSFPDILAAPGDTRYRDLFTEPNGSGCVVDGTSLPDGVWFGFVRSVSAGRLTFDLACFFACKNALVAAAEDGAAASWALELRGSREDGSPVYDETTVYARNRNPLLFTVPIDPEGRAWVASARGATGVEHLETPLDEWLGSPSLLECPGPACGVWLYVNGGRVTALVEQFLFR